jgi:hypothetical protein
MLEHTSRSLPLFCVVGLLSLLTVTPLPYLRNLQPTHWVGSTDLTIEFVVTDVQTGAPIRGATVSLFSGAGSREEVPSARREGFGHQVSAVALGPAQIELATNELGTVRHVCRETICFGTRGPVTDSCALHLPDWNIAVSAAGYTNSAPVSLEVLPGRRAIERTGPGQMRFVVPVELTKAQQ